jgi:integrase
VGFVTAVVDTLITEIGVDRDHVFATGVSRGGPDSKDGLPEFVCRFHDLRQRACTRMIQAKIPIIAQLVGWSYTTMWQMAARYGHYDDSTMRKAVETISAAKPQQNLQSRHSDFSSLEAPS